MLQITPNTSPKEISDYIARLREKKGNEKATLVVIKKALMFGHNFVVNLLWEEALTYQHLVMNEDAKGESGDLKVRLQNLRKMEEVVKRAGYYIVRFDLEMWKSRLYRFLGRVCDYKGDYKRAVNYYRKSIKLAKFDPEYMENKIPRWLEGEAFISYSLIMLGQTGKGHTLARTVYDKFDSTAEAKNLKQQDLTTWLIWKSGIPIRTINALMDKKIVFNTKEAYEWLNDVEEMLKSVKNKKLWADLKYRMGELNSVKKRLEISNN